MSETKQKVKLGWKYYVYWFLMLACVWGCHIAKTPGGFLLFFIFIFIYWGAWVTEYMKAHGHWA